MGWGFGLVYGVIFLLVEETGVSRENHRKLPYDNNLFLFGGGGVISYSNGMHPQVYNQHILRFQQVTCFVFVFFLISNKNF
jgi:hypothetical protein